MTHHCPVCPAEVDEKPSADLTLTPPPPSPLGPQWTAGGLMSAELRSGPTLVLSYYTVVTPAAAVSEACLRPRERRVDVMQASWERGGKVQLVVETY